MINLKEEQMALIHDLREIVAALKIQMVQGEVEQNVISVKSTEYCDTFDGMQQRYYDPKIGLIDEQEKHDSYLPELLDTVDVDKNHIILSRARAGVISPLHFYSVPHTIYIVEGEAEELISGEVLKKGMSMRFEKGVLRSMKYTKDSVVLTAAVKNGNDSILTELVSPRGTTIVKKDITQNNAELHSELNGSNKL